MSTLAEKLSRLLPGARAYVVGMARPSDAMEVESWRVELNGRVLAVGHSEREAIDRALFLYGGQR